jgi:hypothetical protein
MQTQGYQTKTIMKNILKISALLLVLQATSCDDNEVSPKSQEVNLLTASPWSHSTVIHATDGDLSEQYRNFVISFTNAPSSPFEGNFVVSNGGHAFPETTGKWKLNDDLTLIIFDSGRELNYDIDNNTLHLDFTVAPIGGRVAGLSGHFTFELKPL